MDKFDMYKTEWFANGRSSFIIGMLCQLRHTTQASMKTEDIREDTSIACSNVALAP